MTREMYVSSTPHETKVALVEDDQLAELFFERENEYTLAGSIYKGRVTRVLPGMQSAFVDIGLERDAFLYVSDFLEIAGDEESEFEEIAVSRPEAFVSSRPPQEPRFESKPEASSGPGGATTPYQTADSTIEDRSEEELLQGNTQEFTEKPLVGEGQEASKGDFRGNRRRRGRRTRGFPESKFARPGTRPERAAPERESAPAPEYTPVILPGESISKYQPAGPAVQQEPGTTPPSREPQPPSVAAPSAPPSSHPVPLGATTSGTPGTSVTGGGRGADAGAARSSSGRFTVLPGESIAKYQSQTEELVRDQAEHAAESEERLAEQAATFVIESEPWPETLGKEIAPEAVPSGGTTSDLPRAPEPERRLAEELRHQDIIAVPHGDEKNVRSSKPVSGEFHPPDTEPGHDGKEFNRVEGMNVAAVFGGEAVENEEPDSAQANAPAEETAPLASSILEPESLEPAAPAAPAVEDPGIDPARAHDEQHVFGAAGAGALQHEEIEGEETELHPAGEDENDAELLELEEETFERDSGPKPGLARTETGEQTAGADWNRELTPGEQLTEAVEESDTDRAAMSGVYETEEEGGLDQQISFEEQEFSGENELELPEEQQEESLAGGRAEVRGPSGTSGYQRTFEPRRERRGARRPPLRRREPPHPHVPISDLLKEGQEILVQIAKEPIGKKGARITSHIALPGRFLVYMPTINHVGVSRKIGSDEERQRLKRIMLSEREGGHGGFIVRTAAAGIGEDELRADIRFLKNLWAQIKQRSDNSKGPALIYHDLNLVERILRDLVNSDFSQIWVDSEQEYERIVNFANRFQPSLVRRVKLYTKTAPLFEQFGIHEEIDKALKSKVWLKSGGYIVINQTEALVAIDVNTGKYVGKTARLEDTIVKTNVDAIKEIVRQIRLRDLGGIIVIDFIDMDERKNRQKVMQALEEALQYDRAPSKVLAFNDFGLVAITRKRVKQSLERTLGGPCPYCGGNGFVKSVTTICNEIYTELRKMRPHLEDSEVVNLRVNPEIAKALKANSGRRLQDFEELTGRTVLVSPDPLLHQEQFDIH